MSGAVNYDTFVCGSDQIWNPILYGVHPIWTMKFAPKGSKKIAYAPSLGISDIPEQYIATFKENLKDYAYISCREQEGANSLSKILGRNIDVVLDPTLLLSPDQWHEFAIPVSVNKPYIFCYLFGSYPYIAEVKKRVKDYYGINMVCLPYNLRELKSDDLKLYDITPNQFVWLIENAKFVVTDSFHATVFSIKMNTPFVSLKRTSDNDRKIISMLYQPIMGSIATSLYYTLWADLNKSELLSNEYTHHHLMTSLRIKMDAIITARKKLEAIGLVKTFIKKGESNSYVYELYSPISASEFFNHPILNIVLYNNIGKISEVFHIG